VNFTKESSSISFSMLAIVVNYNYSNYSGWGDFAATHLKKAPPEILEVCCDNHESLWKKFDKKTLN